jgi:hypothetical protein
MQSVEDYASWVRATPKPVELAYPRESYFICWAPRCGSWLLCWLLEAQRDATNDDGALATAPKGRSDAHGRERRLAASS